MRIIFLAAVALSMLTPAGCKECEHHGNGAGAAATGLQVPSFVVEQAKAGNLVKTKLYVDGAGNVAKFAIYVTAEALPEWVAPMADKTIGKGEFESAEIERYGDGTIAYELTRIVDGKKVELSVGEDKIVRYIERALNLDELPEAVATAAKKVSGLVVLEAESKTSGDTVIYEIEGKLEGADVVLQYDAKGGFLNQGISVPGSALIQTN